MAQDCDHSDADWDWGSVQPSDDHVEVPGYCWKCETEVTRYYDFLEILEQ